jgi:hypothetical protein
VDLKELVPVAEAAEYANIDQKTVHNAIRRGILPHARKPGGQKIVLIRTKAVLDAIEDGRIKRGRLSMGNAAQLG